MGNRLLLINPPIHDFSAFNLWARPLGLLKVAAFLRNLNFSIDFIDCLSLEHGKEFLDSNPKIKPSKQKKFSTYQYFREEIKKPAIYSTVKRHYHRFGINPAYLKKLLLQNPKPRAVLVASMMTYWYPGVFEVINLVKEVFPNTPVILGGIYAKLSTEHAKKYSNADFIYSSYGLKELISLLKNLLNLKKKDLAFPYGNLNYFSYYPALDLYQINNFIPIELSAGCIFRCKYCASHYLTKKYIERNPQSVIEEITFWKKRYNIQDIAFYDDALLINKKNKIIPVLQSIIQKNLNINLHTPNGLHIRYMDNEIIGLMKKAKVKTIRLSLESNSRRIQSHSSYKTNNSDFLRTVNLLFRNGYTEENIGVYILMGLPGQSIEEVYSAINFVKKTGIKPKLSEYSPLPHTSYLNNLKNDIKTKILNEPLLQNNSTLHLWSKVFTSRVIEDLKQYARE